MSTPITLARCLPDCNVWQVSRSCRLPAKKSQTVGITVRACAFRFITNGRDTRMTLSECERAEAARRCRAGS